jgi:hypothetical protein
VNSKMLLLYGPKWNQFALDVPPGRHWISGHPAVQAAVRNRHFDSLSLPRLYVPVRHNPIEKSARRNDPRTLQLLRNPHAVSLQFQAALKASATPFMQYRRPVGGGPSGNT